MSKNLTINHFRCPIHFPGRKPVSQKLYRIWLAKMLIEGQLSMEYLAFIGKTKLSTKSLPKAHRPVLCRFALKAHAAQQARAAQKA